MLLNNLIIILQIVFVIRYNYVTSIISSNVVKLYANMIKTLFYIIIY